MKVTDRHLGGFTFRLFMRRMASALLVVFYPPVCSHCGGAIQGLGRLLCAACEQCLELYDAEEGRVFAVVSESGLMWLSPLCVYRKGGVVAGLIHDFKYRGMRRVGRDLGRRYGAYLQGMHAAKGDGYEAVLPVPMHWWRFLRRGFNQSALLARAVAGVLGCRFRSDVLYCRRYRVRQVGKSAEERQANVRGKFGIHASEVRPGGRYLLVDDVRTTGATARACAELLLKEGACEVHIAVLAAVVGDAHTSGS